MPENLIPIRLSPTKLQRWYEAGCPARWWFDSQWEPLVPNEFLLTGLEVHSLMEGRRIIPTQANTMKFYERLKETLYLADITIDFTEVKLEWEILPGVTWVEKLDGIGRRSDNTPVVVDYKSNWGKGWKPIKGTSIYPLAEDFQTASYLLEPPKEVWDKTEWPMTMIYLIAPLWGPPQIIKVEWDMDRQLNLVAAIKTASGAMRATDMYAKVKGKECLDCPFLSPCYGLEDWSVNFRPKVRSG